MPKLAANAIDANPSRIDFKINCSEPLPRPSSNEPRIVNGPTQKTSDAVRNPSMKRWRSPVAPAPASRSRSHPPTASRRLSTPPASR